MSIGGGGGGSAVKSSVPGGQAANSSRYKTELCRPFQENGACKYGDKCQFAHGMHELRGLVRHPKYKTELCRTFHTIGFCPYGPRCHFIHNADEKRSPAPAPPRPRLGHSVSFAGFPASMGRLGAPALDSPPLLERPASVSPPPGFFPEEPTLMAPSPASLANNAFTFSSQEMLFGPLKMHHVRRSPSPSTSDVDLASGSSSDCESPVMDPSARRLPIFSQLSTSDD